MTEKAAPIYRLLDAKRQPVAAFDDLMATTRAALGTAAPDADTSDPTSIPAEPARPAAVATRAQLAGALIAVAVVGLAVLFMARSVPSVPLAAIPATAPAAAATPAPTAPSGAAVLPQSPAPILATLERPVGAFAAPDGAYLGTIEAGRAYTPTARLGTAWTQIEAAGSGRVWIAARELAPDVALVDLTPPTPIPTSPPPPPAAPAVVYREAPPAPTQCATVSGGGVSVQRCGADSYDALQAEAQAAWDTQIGRDRTLAQTVTPDTYGGKRP